MYDFLKRVGDVSVAVIVLLVLALPLVLLLLALRFTGEGEVFYKQRRIGRGARAFGIYKFAAILKDSPNMTLGHITVRDDPRVTPVGKYLRSSKVNELPQIFNIIEGTMSWVGPRPLVERALEVYTDEGRARILSVKPGVTGLGSLYFRDEEGVIAAIGGDPRVVYDIHIAPYKEALELWYVEHRGLATDFKLLVLTALAVVAPQAVELEDFFTALPIEPAELASAKTRRGTLV